MFFLWILYQWFIAKGSIHIDIIHVFQTVFYVVFSFLKTEIQNLTFVTIHWIDVIFRYTISFFSKRYIRIILNRYFALACPTLSIWCWTSTNRNGILILLIDTYLFDQIILKLWIMCLQYLKLTPVLFLPILQQLIILFQLLILLSHLIFVVKYHLLLAPLVLGKSLKFKDFGMWFFELLRRKFQKCN